MAINFNEINLESCYKLEVKLAETGNTYKGYFEDLRVDRKSLPAGYYAYDIRDDDCDGEPCQVAKGVMCNHMGTLITTEPITEIDTGKVFGWLESYKWR